MLIEKILKSQFFLKRDIIKYIYLTIFGKILLKVALNTISLTLLFSDFKILPRY